MLPALLIASLLSTQASTDRLWTSRQPCSGATRVRATITYNERTVYRGVLALCQRQRDQLPATEPRVTKFSFFGTPRDFASSAPSEQRRGIEGRIWELSADADGIRVGIAFAAGSDILLNTIRSVSPTATSKDTLAANLTVSFEPQVR